ncbi:hypothetical protein [Nostoc sp. FACHB-190]|uniref:hypothetical protein n=1 Tax=Nostoc sp. FACHB-190 TaxID=2692838 RepID=UPI001688404F|nr:hypothetical protein [Nostoc sp. FACHB-190]MBD2299837.1 hypothetical protein [Nostoc sp. FACHB-190]
MEYICTDTEHQSYLDINSKLSKTEKILKIGAYIVNLPDDSVLKSLCKTEDLQFLWWKMRCFYGQIAECFCLLFLKENIEERSFNIKDIFKDAFDKKCISRNDVHIYTFETERILKEWNLIEAGFPYLIAEMPNFPFNEDIKLFFDFLDNQATEQIKRHTAKYYEININERSKIYGQVYEAARGKSDNINKLLTNPIIHRYKLKEEIIKFLCIKSQVDPVIQQNLKALQTAHNDFDLLAVENCKNRNSSGKTLKSEVWKNGERYILTKKGLIKEPLIEELRAYFSESSLQEARSVLQQFVHCN